MKKKIATLVFSALCLLVAPAAFSQTEAASQPPTQTAPPAASAQPALATAPAISPAQPAPATAGDLLQPAGQVVWVNGTVKATYPEQTPRILARGAMIYEKDTLTTDKDSTGQISFTDNTMLSLRPNTTLNIEQYYFNQQKPTQGGQFIMKVIEGGFRTITGFVAKAQPANYQVKTPVATIGVRGTDYAVICVSRPSPICNFGLLKGLGVTLTNTAGTVALTPQLPYAVGTSPNTLPRLSSVAPGFLENSPTITPANAPLPGVTGGNCGILIN